MGTLETYLANARVIFFRYLDVWPSGNALIFSNEGVENVKLHLLHKEGINQKKQNMWTTSNIGINSG